MTEWYRRKSWIIKIKHSLRLLGVLLLGNIAFAQLPSNSFEGSYKDKRWLEYKHYEIGHPESSDEKKSIHDYSGNWDFDGDKKLDKLTFIGKGGAHLYYYLKIEFSKTGKSLEIPFIESDFPMFSDSLELKIPGMFSVKDLKNDGIPEIVIKLDEQSKATFPKHNIKTNIVCLIFNNGRVFYKDLSEYNKIEKK
jgi:hypothetical protein